MGETSRIQNGALKIRTNRTNERSSSNQSFNEKFRAGLKTGVDVGNTAVRNVLRPIPGSAVLSSSLSSAAASLGGPSSLSGLSNDMAPSIGGALGGMNNASGALGGVNGDIGSLQDEMVKNNNDLIEKQWAISQISTFFTTQTNMIKNLFETLKAIASNIR
jgi:hypothetical protein